MTDAVLSKKLAAIEKKETLVGDSPEPCPSCAGGVKRYRSCTVSNSIDALSCTSCLWFAPACGKRGCTGHMIGSVSSGTTVRWRCAQCGWSGMGYPMVAPGIPFGWKITIEPSTGKTPESIYREL